MTDQKWIQEQREISPFGGEYLKNKYDAIVDNAVNPPNSADTDTVGGGKIKSDVHCRPDFTCSSNPVEVFVEQYNHIANDALHAQMYEEYGNKWANPTDGGMNAGVADQIYKMVNINFENNPSIPQDVRDKLTAAMDHILDNPEYFGLRDNKFLGVELVTTNAKTELANNEYHTAPPPGGGSFSQ